jgi:hypothetical protein
VKLLLIGHLAFLNRLFIVIEDFLFPSLKQVEHDLFNTPNRLVLIIGHGRSGTTNLHKGLSSLEGVATGHNYDFLMPSLILKYVFYPFVGVLDYVLFKKLVDADGTPNHKLGLWEELEENFYLLNQHSSEVYPNYIMNTLGLKSMRQMTKFDGRNLDFVKKCISRSLYFQGKTN